MLSPLKRLARFRSRKRSRISGRIWRRGSFTVEAVVLFPVIVLLIAFILRLSMDWYESVQQAAADIDALQQLDTRALFLNRSTLRGILDSLK